MADDQSRSTEQTRKRNIEKTEKLAGELDIATSNGNRDSVNSSPAGSSDGLLGGAEKGGPDLDKARERQPPDADLDHLDLDRSLI
jgi:hypothetical protein